LREGEQPPGGKREHDGDNQHDHRQDVEATALVLLGHPSPLFSSTSREAAPFPGPSKVPIWAGMNNAPEPSPDPVIAVIAFDGNGLVPAIAQQHDTGEVLMMAWMNREAVAETLATGRVCYWSRSRNRLWRKGETSGQRQHLKEFRIDCDGDTILLLVDQEGVACHTGR